MTDDLRRRLEALGEIEPPQLDEDRIDAIGARVMAATTEHAPVGVRRRTMALGTAAVLVALLIAGVVLATTRGADDLVLELADGVTIELPEAAAEPGTAGDALPDGTVVTVGDGGVAGVDGRRFGAGRYLVVGGELVRLDVGTATTTTTTTTTTTVKPTRATELGDDPNDRRDAVEPVPTTVVPPNRTTTVPSRDPAVRPPIDGTRPPDTTTTRPTTIADRPTTIRPATSTTTLPDRTTTTIPRTTTTPPRDRPTTSPPTTVGDRPPSDGS